MSERASLPEDDALPTDFTSFVAARRGLSPEQALECIGEWLHDYEPLSALPRPSPSVKREPLAIDTIVQSWRPRSARMVGGEPLALY